MSSTERAEDALLNPIVASKPELGLGNQGDDDEDWAELLGYSTEPEPEAIPQAQTSEEERALLAEHDMGPRDPGSITAESIVTVDHGVKTKPRIKLGQVIKEDIINPDTGAVGDFPVPHNEKTESVASLDHAPTQRENVYFQKTPGFHIPGYIIKKDGPDEIPPQTIVPESTEEHYTLNDHFYEQKTPKTVNEITLERGATHKEKHALSEAQKMEQVLSLLLERKNRTIGRAKEAGISTYKFWLRAGEVYDKIPKKYKYLGGAALALTGFGAAAGGYAVAATVTGILSGGLRVVSTAASMVTGKKLMEMVSNRRESTGKETLSEKQKNLYALGFTVATFAVGQTAGTVFSSEIQSFIKSSWFGEHIAPYFSKSLQKEIIAEIPQTKREISVSAPQASTSRVPEIPTEPKAPESMGSGTLGGDSQSSGEVSGGGEAKKEEMYAAPKEVAKEKIVERVHKVKKGDTLWKLVSQEVGDDLPGEDRTRRIAQIISEIQKNPNEYGVTSGNVNEIKAGKDFINLAKIAELNESDTIDDVVVSEKAFPKPKVEAERIINTRGNPVTDGIVENTRRSGLEGTEPADKGGAVRSGLEGSEPFVGQKIPGQAHMGGEGSVIETSAGRTLSGLDSSIIEKDGTIAPITPTPETEGVQRFGGLDTKTIVNGFDAPKSVLDTWDPSNSKAIEAAKKTFHAEINKQFGRDGFLFTPLFKLDGIDSPRWLQIRGMNMEQFGKIEDSGLKKWFESFASLSKLEPEKTDTVDSFIKKALFVVSKK